MTSPIRVLAIAVDGVSSAVATRLVDSEFDVVAASSGLDAVKRLDDEPVDCVVVDTDVAVEDAVTLVADAAPAVPIVLVGATADRSVPVDVDRASIEGLPDAVRAATAGVRADTVRRAHGRLKNALRSVAVAILGGTDRDGLERRVYESLTETGCYQFVWVGEFDAAAGEFESRIPVEGRFGGPALESLAGTGDDNLLQRAADTGRVTVSRDAKSTRGTAATAAPGQASPGRVTSGTRLRVAAVPFTDGDALVGAALVSTDREAAFDEAERALLADIGSIVGAGLAAGEPADAEPADRAGRRFADLLAHEVRSPLGIASSQLELARESGDEEHFERTRDALNRIEETIEAILDVSKAADGVEPSESVDLRAAVADAWEEVDAPDASMQVDSSGRLLADRDLLVRLLVNLFRNAIEHGGATVEIRVGRTDTGFYVEDDGPGIAAADRDRVFDWGFSTADDGLGIGLGLVKEIVASHGWAVDVEAAEPGGARFTVTGVGSPDPTL